MAKKKQINHQTLFEKINAFLGKKELIWFWILFGITLVTGLLLYDPRVSLSGDDSSYILRANDFLKKMELPSYQGPLYPVALSLVMLIFGFNLLPLKLFSLVAILGFFYLTFIAFRRRVPSLLLFCMLLLTSLNAHLLYFGSQTFSEGFYMFLQSLVMLIFFTYFIGRESQEVYLIFKHDFKRHLLLALVILLLVVTRTIGYSMLIATIGYFIFYKQWKNIGLHLASFLLLFAVYAAIVHFIWGNEIFPSAHGSSLLNKSFYRPELGNEDLKGLFFRFLQNSEQYLSGKLYGAMGLIHIHTRDIILAGFTYLVAIGALCFSYKKNRFLFFTGLLTGTFLITTFVILQVEWNQQRLIMPVYPYILLLLLATCYYILELRRVRFMQFLFLLPVVLLLFSGTIDTKNTISEVRKIKTEFDGLTPDWYNYTKASRWVGDNLKEKNVLVACRKPEISTIYAKGKPFYGIYTIPTIPLETFLHDWEISDSEYVVYDMTKVKTQGYLDLIFRNYDGMISFNNYKYTIAKYPDMQSIPVELKEMEPFLTPQQLKNFIDKPCSIFMADSLLMDLKNAGVSHILAASLRVNPNENNGNTISTVERYVSYFAAKYPYLLNGIYQEGTEKNEPAQLFRIEWEQLDSK